MKKLILLLLLISCSIYTVKASMPINIGIRAGLLNSKLETKNLKDIASEAKNGFMVGAFARINLGSIYLEPGLSYERESSQQIIEAQRYKVNIDAFKIPIKVGIELLDLNLIKCRLFAGPQFSVGNFGDLKALYKNIKNTNDAEDLKALKTNLSYWEGRIGIGVDVWKATFDIDYSSAFKGIDDIIKTPSSFNFTLGFKIL